MTSKRLRNQLCERLGAQVPIFGFTHSLDAAIAVSRSGGIGIWGATRSTPGEIEEGVSRMAAELGDLPYGLDLVIPPGMPERDNRDEIEAAIPDAHRAFIGAMREKYGVPDDDTPGMRSRFVRSEQMAREQVDVVMDSSISVLALGIGSPEWVIGPAKERGKTLVSLVGQPKHALKALQAGADILVAQGTDAGAHTGPVGTFSLVPQIVDVAGDVPVVAAGGVATGRHIAAAMAMGRSGVAGDGLVVLRRGAPRAAGPRQTHRRWVGRCDHLPGRLGQDPASDPYGVDRRVVGAGRPSRSRCHTRTSWWATSSARSSATRSSPSCIRRRGRASPSSIVARPCTRS
ncbi:MAG: nitronate monooxygenase [Acidimicrobiales bacterium]